MNKDKTALNTMPIGIGGAIILVATLLVLGIARLAGWIAWPVVGYILKDAFMYALIGGVTATLVQFWKRAKTLPSKALLLLIGFACIAGITWGAVVWHTSKEPEIRLFEGFLHTLTSLSAMLAGCFMYETQTMLAGRTIEPTEDGPVARLLMAGLEKLTPKGFLISGGAFMLLVALWAYTKDSSPDNPYVIPGTIALGLGSILQGIEMWIAPRFPRLARGLFIASAGLLIVVLYFFARMLFYR